MEKKERGAFWRWLLFPAFAAFAAEAGDIRVAAEALSELEPIDQMRYQLARSLDSNASVTEETFAQVCKPVGASLKQLAQNRQWRIRQLAVKYRNPDHEPTPQQKKVFAEFARQPGRELSVVRESHGGREGIALYRRITVQRACLHCHGVKGARPEFIKKKYPRDKAYDFKMSDLRGLYWVFIPDSEAAK